MSNGVTLTSRNSRSLLSRSTNSIVLVTSTVIHSVTCGAVKAEPTIAAAVTLRTPLIGVRVSPRSANARAAPAPLAAPAPAPAPGGAGGIPESYAVAPAPPAAPPDPARKASTSSRVIVSPPAGTIARSTPRSLAYLRTGGLASTCACWRPACCGWASSVNARVSRRISGAWAPTNWPIRIRGSLSTCSPGGAATVRTNCSLRRGRRLASVCLMP